MLTERVSVGFSGFGISNQRGVGGGWGGGGDARD